MDTDGREFVVLPVVTARLAMRCGKMGEMVDKDAFEAVGQMVRQKAPHILKAYPHVIERPHWLWSSPGTAGPTCRRS